MMTDRVKVINILTRH